MRPDRIDPAPSTPAAPLGCPADPEPVRRALRQVAGLVEHALRTRMIWAPDSSSFSAPGGLGWGSIDENEPAIVLRLTLVQAPARARLPLAAWTARLSDLGDRCRLTLAPVAPPPDLAVICAEIRVQATPLGAARMGALADQIARVCGAGEALRAELPPRPGDARLDQPYQKLQEWLERVPPSSAPPELEAWAQRTFELCLAGAPIALVAEHGAVRDCALTALAAAADRHAMTIGRPLLATLPAREVPAAAAKAPGILAVPADRLALGSNPYDLAADVRGMLAALASSRRTVVFVGPRDQLQSVFHGGQGGAPDPLVPIVCSIPEPPLPALIRHAVAESARQVEALPRGVDLVAEVERVLAAVAPAERVRLLPLVATRLVRDEGADAATLISTLAGRTETFAGLSTRPRAERLARLRDRLVDVLGGPSLLAALRRELVGQDAALAALAERLRAEALCRADHQPVRWCAQGTPGTGKSESARLVAGLLDVPYVTIDAPSLSDPHTAAAQLLGSGRGIVGSHQAGRLEQCARQPGGALIEIADLDHASPAVRSFLADLFLQVLETGEGQSATGAVFSCANLVFAFTMNLPDGADDAVHRGIGFDRTPSRTEVTRRVVAEMQRLLSGAFLSRVGTPIVFSPLDDAALAMVIERAVGAGARTAASRLGGNAVQVALERDLGLRVLDSTAPGQRVLGARVLLEHARALVAAAAPALRDRLMERGRTGALTLIVALAGDGRLEITLG